MDGLCRKYSANTTQNIGRIAFVKLHLDTRRAKSNSTYPLKLSVYHKRDFLVPIGVDIFAEEWDGEKIINNKEAKSLNSYIQLRLSSAQSLIFNLELHGKLARMSNSELRQIIKENSPEAAKSNNDGICLYDYFVKYKNSIKNTNNKDTYNATLLKLHAHADIANLPIESIDKDWIRGFDDFMNKDGLSHNTRVKYLQNLRAVIYDAIERELVLMRNPFFKYRFPKYRPNKRPLSIEEIKTLRDYPCEPCQEKYRDCFMLIFYLRGINMIDLAQLTEIKNGRIEYYRSKTGKFYSLSIPDEAMAIICKYRGEEHLLSFFDDRANYKSFEKSMKDNLRKIGHYKMVKGKSGRLNKKEYSPLFPKISPYWARHSIASIASELDIPDKTIEMMLGHGSDNVTQGYITFDQKKVDKAVRKILDEIK